MVFEFGGTRCQKGGKFFDPGILIVDFLVRALAKLGQLGFFVFKRCQGREQFFLDLVSGKLGVGKLAGKGGSAGFKVITLVAGIGKLGRELGQFQFHALIVAALKRQKVGQFIDLSGKVAQCRVTARQGRAKIDLGNDKDHQQEDDHHQKRCQRINKARPRVYIAIATARKTGHAISPPRRWRRWCGRGA